MFGLRLSLTVLTLSLTISSTIGAAVPLLPTAKSEFLILSENKTNSKEVISDLQCECVLFFLCDRENVVVRPTSDDDNDQNECADDFVCCKTSNTELPTATNPSSQENSTIYFPVDSCAGICTEEVTTTEAITDDGIIGQLCECVLPHQCHPENVINLPFTDLQNQCQGENVCCLINSTSPLIPHSSGDNEPSELECECVAFYLCQTDDVVELPITEDKCSIADVCCKKSNSTPLPSPPSTDPTPPTNNTKVIIYGVSNDNEEEKLQCECISFFLCPEENIIELPTTYNNEDQCSLPDFCCKRSNSTSTTTLKPPEVTTVNTSKVITYGVSDDYYPKELKCECVYFYLCPEGDVIELTTTYNEKDRCSDSLVCCKTPDFISLPTPQVPEPAPSNTTKEVIVYGVSDGDEPTELTCICMPFYLCESSDIIVLPTMYNNKDQCVVPDVCCKIPEFTSSVGPEPSKPEPPKPEPSNNKTKEVVICGVDDDNEPEELECECVLFYLCPAENVVKLPANRNNRDPCSEPNVCCRRPQMSTSTSSISSPQEPSSKRPDLPASTSSISPPPEPPLPPEPLPPNNVKGRPVTMEFSFKITWWR